MFELSQVGLKYGTEPALAEISLAIDAGEQVALIGPSGAGKTSLLALLNGRLFPTEGEVRVKGNNLDELSTKELRVMRQALAWIPQDLGLIPSLRVAQNVACGQVGKKGFWGLLRSFLFMSRAEKEAIGKRLEEVGVLEKMFQRVDHLSGGQQQRAAVARALYQGPTAILADEPVSAVDPERGRDLIKLLVKVSREQGVTLVTSLHDVSLALESFDRVIGLREGRIVFDGRPSEEELTSLYQLS